MSEDETLVFVGCGLASAFAWGHWYWGLIRFKRRAGDGRRLLAGAPLIAGALLFLLLRVWSADDVRNDPAYLGLYWLMGAAWAGLSRAGLAWLGLSVRDDVLERGNGAAATAIGGAVVGLTLCFAGGNFGNGPGWWVVVFAAGLATTGFYVAWGLLGRFGGLAEAITVERDPAAGWRAAAFFVSTGMVLGRAVAGDWVSVTATVADFARRGWPVLLLLAVAGASEQFIRPATDRAPAAIVAAGLFPGLVYLALALVIVGSFGPW